MSCCGGKNLLHGLAMVLLECLWVSLVELLALPCVWYISCSFLHILLCLHPHLASRFCLRRGVAFFLFLCGLHEDHVAFFHIIQGVYIFCAL